MLSLDVDYNDFNASNARAMNEKNLVRFFTKEVKDDAATMAEGRPIYKEVEYIEIRILGKRDVQACRPATYRDKQDYGAHYKAFKDRVEMPVEGTPLAEWPQISRSQVEELSYLKVKTVEQLADISDTNISQFQGGFNLRRRAQEWLESSGETKLIAEKEALEKRLADMEAKLASVLAEKTEAKPAAKAVNLESDLDTETESDDTESETPRKSRRRR
jgi:hypothetical protein